MFKNFLHNETTPIIGLKSLGLTNKTTSPQKTQQTTYLFSKNKTEKSINLNTQAQEPKTLDELFGRSLKLNLNK